MAEVEALDALEDAQERFLREVAGVFIARDHVARSTPGAALVPAHEGLERGLVAGLSRAHEVVVGRSFRLDR